jgi:hypothetical protein
MKTNMKWLAIILVGAFSALAQSVSLSGKVLDPDGKPLPGVQVELKAIGLKALTASDGRFTLTKSATGLTDRSGKVIRQGGFQPERLPSGQKFRVALADQEGRELDRTDITEEEARAGFEPNRYFPGVRRPGCYVISVSSNSGSALFLAYFDGRHWMGKMPGAFGSRDGAAKKSAASLDTLVLYLSGYKVKRIPIDNLRQNLADIALEREFFEGSLTYQFGKNSGFTGGDAPRVAQDGLVGWGSSRVVSFLNDSKGAQEASLQLEWSIRAPKSAIFELSLSEWVYLQGSATVNGSGWFGTGIDSRLKITVDLVLEAGSGPPNVAYHADVYEDATKSENRRKTFDGSFQTPGKIYVQAKEGETVRMYLLLKLTSTANSEGSCSATINAFGPAATWDNPDFVSSIKG